MNISRLFSLFLIGFLPVFGFTQGWERKYGQVGNLSTTYSRALVAKPDGGFHVLLSTTFAVPNEDFYLLDVDASGAVQSVKTFGPPDLDPAAAMVATPDGGLAILSTKIIFDPVQEKPDMVLTKLDAQLNEEWRIYVGEPDVWEYGHSLLADAGGFWISGNGGVFPGSSFLYRVDLQGNVLFYTYAGFDHFYTVKLLPGAAGGVRVFGFSNAVNSGIYQVVSNTYDASGNLIAQTDYNLAGPAVNLVDAVPTSDGGLVLTGLINQLPYLQKVGPSGTVGWQILYGSNTSVKSVHPKADGSGYRLLMQRYIDGHDAITLAEAGPDGQLIWQKSYGGAAWSTADVMLTLPDDSHLLAGEINNANYSDENQPYLIRTDAGGNTYLSGITGTIGFDPLNTCTADTVRSGDLVTFRQNNEPVAWAKAGADGRYFLPLEAGEYEISVGKPNPAWTVCPQSLQATVTANDTVENQDFVLMYQPQPLDSIFGYLYYDTDGDCQQDSFETTGYAGWTVNAYFYGGGAVLGSFTTTTDENGYYVFDQLAGLDNSVGVNVIVELPGPGTGLYCAFLGCAQEAVFNFQNGPSQQSDFGFRCDTLPDCPIMRVDIATGLIRPCLPAHFQVHYSNIGVQSALDASIEVELDAGLSVTASTLPWSAVNGNTYTFPLGNLLPGQMGNFTISAEVTCDDPVGTTYCVEAHAYPDTCSLPSGLDWDGAQVQVTAACEGDSVVFTIQNVGQGNMTSASDYVVVEDNVLLMIGNFQLDAGDFIEVVLPADGSFFRLQADQSEGFPGPDMPVAWVEGCGGAGATQLGLVNQYWLGDPSSWLDVFCLESVNSYDPNDKQGFPRGYGDQHFIDQNIDMEYLIRFQNTGTAPALQVEIRDTLPVQWLDPATVRPGASSHTYEWDMQGNGVVVFRFPDINLPDSSANFDASNGFIKFTVSQRPDLPLGTMIENRAAIYFDNNDPVITNTSWHTISKDFITVSHTVSPLSGLDVTLAPNPAGERTRIHIVGLRSTATNTLLLRNALGQPVASKTFSGADADLETARLEAGVYFYELSQQGRVLATGRLMKL